MRLIKAGGLGNVRAGEVLVIVVRAGEVLGDADVRDVGGKVGVVWTTTKGGARVVVTCGGGGGNIPMILLSFCIGNGLGNPVCVDLLCSFDTTKLAPIDNCFPLFDVSADDDGLMFETILFGLGDPNPLASG